MRTKNGIRVSVEFIDRESPETFTVEVQVPGEEPVRWIIAEVDDVESLHEIAESMSPEPERKRNIFIRFLRWLFFMNN